MSQHDSTIWKARQENWISDPDSPSWFGLRRSRPEIRIRENLSWFVKKISYGRKSEAACYKMVPIGLE